MYQNLKRTCRAIIFAHKAFCFVAMSLMSLSCFHKVSIINIKLHNKQKLGLSN